jgi:hypothetical protein
MSFIPVAVAAGLAYAAVGLARAWHANPPVDVEGHCSICGLDNQHVLWCPDR